MGMLDSMARTIGFGQQKQQPQQQTAQQGNNFSPDTQQTNMQFQPGMQGNGADMQGKGPGGATMPNMDGNNNNNNNGQGNNGNSGQPKADPGPMDKFGNIFDNSKNTPEEAPKFTLDGKTLDSVASKQDFFQGIDPAILQAADGGDPKAMREVMQAGMRNAYKTALQHAGTLTENFVGSREEHQNKGFGKRVKSELTAASMASHPAMKNPVVKQQMNETAQRFATQHPDASPDEIKSMTMDYFQTIAGMFTEKKQGTEQTGTPANADFGAWFGDDEQSQSSGQQGSSYFN